MIDKAIKLAAEVHEGQVDKGGEPYILHPIAVMELCRKANTLGGAMKEIVLTTAILHDVLEDFKGSKQEKDELKIYIVETFGAYVYTSVETLTRNRDESYHLYILRIEGDPIARTVKIADLTHNMDVTRLPSGDITAIDFERWDKYRKALVRLKREE
jgi:guanosine-3',5'-bis(diphosphate) 3'-pyrophosphohydrolase